MVRKKTAAAAIRQDLRQLPRSSGQPSRRQRNEPAINAFCRLLALVCTTVLVGCSPALSPDEQVVSEAFTALKSRNWAAYKKLTVTSADFVLKAQGLSPFASGQSYAGSVLRPEEKLAQKSDFERATSGSVQLLDRGRADLAGVSKAGAFEKELLVGGRLPVRVYRVILRVDGKIVPDGRGMPRFLIVDWNKEPRLLGLAFK